MENTKGKSAAAEENIDAANANLNEDEETISGSEPGVKSTDFTKEIKKLQEDLSAKQNEHDALYDKYLRVSAEYENFRKRTTKEKENIYFESTVDVLKVILPVLDNIERAMQFTETGSSAEKLAEGLKMVHTQFMASFERLGVYEIKAMGEKFDPEFHNAVFHEEDESQPENTIAEVLQKGYIKGEKVIRPAMVKVLN